MQLEKSNILSAFNPKGVIGSKVVCRGAFLSALESALETHDTANDRVEGQHFVRLPKSAWNTVSAGVGRQSYNSNDYVVRMHRGQPTVFLRREMAAEVEGLACVVYTRDAYLDDPDTKKDPKESARIRASDCTHVIVAVLAFAGPQAPLSPYRLVHNLAGGNNEVAGWTMDEVQAKAVESLEYWNTWAVVAD